MLKRLFTVLFIGCLLTPSSALAKKVKIKMATMAPKGSAFYNIVKEMGNEWKTVSNNQVRLKIYPGGVAGSDVDVVRKMKLGTVNAGLITSTGLATVHKAVNAFQLPATYRTPAELDYVVSKLGDEVARLYEENGMIVLSWGEAGWIRFLSKSPMMDPSDRAQHKMFIVAGNKVQEGLWRSAGFNVVPLPMTEISTGLQTGLITAVPTTAQTALMFQWYQHANHMMSHAWAPLMGGIVVDKRVWDKIDAPLRGQLKAIAEKYGRQLLEKVRPGEDSALEAMKGRGLKVHRSSPEQQAAWQKLAAESQASLRGPYVPEDIFDKVQAHLKAYRESR